VGASQAAAYRIDDAREAGRRDEGGTQDLAVGGHVGHQIGGGAATQSAKTLEKRWMEG
jgi:hypothetical protein